MAVLVLMTGFFVAGEFALVAVDRSRVKRLAAEGDRRAAQVEKSLSRLSFELSGAQLGITITSLITGAIAEPALSGIFEPLLDRIGWEGVTDRPVVAIGLALLVANLASMLSASLIPKNFALARPFVTAKAISIPMSWLNGLLRPIILLLNRAANWTVRKFGIEPREELAGVRSLEELELIIRSSGEEGELDDAELSLLTRAISFTEKVAADVMVPRVSVEGLTRLDSVADLRRISRKNRALPVPDLRRGSGRDRRCGSRQRHLPVPAGAAFDHPGRTYRQSPPWSSPSRVQLDDLLVDMQRQSRALVGGGRRVRRVRRHRDG